MREDEIRQPSDRPGCPAGKQPVAAGAGSGFTLLPRGPPATGARTARAGAGIADRAGCAMFRASGSCGDSGLRREGADGAS